MRWIGLTGGIGTGKSTVSDALRAAGCAVIDADQVARQVVVKGQPAWAKIRQTFGDVVLDQNLDLDREVLAKIVFSEPGALKVLEQITHPAIAEEVRAQRQELIGTGVAYAFYDVPLLFEKSLEGFDLVVVVYCTRLQQADRLARREEWSESQIAERIAAQIDIEEKRAKADFVIDNTRDQIHLQGEVGRLLEFLKIKWG